MCSSDLVDRCYVINEGTVLCDGTPDQIRGNPEVQEKFNKGPVAILTVFPNGLPNMGKLMPQQIAFFLLGCILVAYCATQVLAAGTDYLVVFRFVSTVSFLAFGWAVIPMSIWYGHPWPTTTKYLLDAVIYGLVVAGSFAWLWPG